MYALFAFPILLIGILFIPTFDGLYGQDSFAYYTYATGSLRDNLPAFAPFFWPPGYPLLVALASYIVGVTPFSGQVIALLGGASVPVFTALFAHEIWPPDDRRVPLLAGLLTALMGQLWQSSIVVMSDAPSLAFGTMGMWMVARYGRRPTLTHLTFATFGLAYAILSRWAYPLVAIPCTIYTVQTMWRLSRKTAIQHFLLATAIVVVVLSPIWWAFLQQTIFAPVGTIAFLGDLGVYGWNPLTGLQRVHETHDGILSYRFPTAVYYVTSPAHPLYFTPLLALFGLVGVWRVWQRRNRELILLLLAWIVLVIGFHSGAPYQNFRFTLVYLPPAAVLVAVGIVCASRIVALRWRPLLTTFVALGFVWMSVAAYTNLPEFIERHSADRILVAWADSQIPDDATVLAFGITATLDYVTDLDIHEAFHLEKSEVAQLVAQSDALYLLLDVENVESQWQGRSPENHYHWLRDNVGLEEIGRRGEYTLFLVSGD